MKQIKISINAMGDQPKVEAIGFAGQGCVEATKGLETVLSGGEVALRDFKDEINSVEDTESEQNFQQW